MTDEIRAARRRRLTERLITLIREHEPSAQIEVQAEGTHEVLDEHGRLLYVEDTRCGLRIRHLHNPADDWSAGVHVIDGNSTDERDEPS